MKIGGLLLQHGLIQAPMAGCADLAFRLLTRPYGMELGFFEMVSSEALVRQTKKTRALLKTTVNDKPVGAQIFGARPSVMGEAAKILEGLGVDLVDINFGCPVPKIAGKGSGCAFLAKPLEAEKILKTVVGAVSAIPVTIKTRLGLNDASGKEACLLAKIAEQAGCAAVTIHGRTKAQGYAGKPHLDSIALVKQSVRIPVIGNGDIVSVESAKTMLKTTGVDALMIGRGALGNPWLYRDIKSFLEKKPPRAPAVFADKKETLLQHLSLELECRDEKTAVLMMRRIACWYFKNLPLSGRFRQELHRCKTASQISALIASFSPIP